MPQNRLMIILLSVSIVLKPLFGTQQRKVVISAPKVAVPVQVLKYALLAIQTGQSYRTTLAIVKVAISTIKLRNASTVHQHNTLMVPTAKIVQLIVIPALSSMEFVQLVKLLSQFRATIPVDVHLVLLTIRIRINANHQLFALQTLF